MEKCYLLFFSGEKNEDYKELCSRETQEFVAHTNLIFLFVHVETNPKINYNFFQTQRGPNENIQETRKTF